MKIQQKRFVLGSPSGRNLKKTDQIVLIVNGKVTNININQVFVKPRIEKDSIIGWSILSQFKLVLHPESQDGFDLQNNNIRICFHNATQNEILLVDGIKNPLFQMNDKTFSDDDVQNFIKVIQDSQKEIPVVAERHEDFDKEVAVLESIGYKKFEFSENGSNPTRENHLSFLHLKDEKPFLIDFVARKTIPLSEVGVNQYQYQHNGKPFVLTLNGDAVNVSQPTPAPEVVNNP